MSRICIIGGTNIDICGTAYEPLKERDSNAGEITVSFGGVGRNIAEICTLLHDNVSFVTCFSDDGYGALLKSDCEKLGMDCSCSITAAGVPSSMYLAILDSDHDMRLAMNDMRLLSHLKTETVQKAAGNLSAEDWLVLDANLEEACIQAALHTAQCPAAADPVSMQKAGKFLPALDRLAVFKPNRFEAEYLNGITIHDAKSARASLQWFLEQGVREVIISMADEGVLLGTQEQCVWMRHQKIPVSNATGGGDAFLGAYIAARARGIEPKDAAYAGIGSAAATIGQNAVRRRTLSKKMIENEIVHMKIRETDL